MSKKSRDRQIETAPVREKIPAVKVVVESVKCFYCGRDGDHEQYGGGITASGMRFKYFKCAHCARRFRANIKEYSAG